MIVPLEIHFHNTQPIEEAETRVRQEVAELEKFYHWLVSCRVDIELPEHRRHGSLSKVRVHLGVPGKTAKQEAEHLELAAEGSGAILY